MTNLQKTTYQKQAPLDTLAQVGKIDRKSPLWRRARRKTITIIKALKLIDYAESIGDKQFVKSCWNTFHCASELVQEGKRLKGKYCKNRSCLVCNDIKTAQLINKDLPIIKQWKEPTFTTLTKRTVSAEELKEELELRLKTFYRIIERLKKRKLFFQGVLKIEIAYNSDQNKYHPHFHLLHENHQFGEIIIEEWLKEFSNGEALRIGQDTKKADQDSLMETYKYSVKLVSKSKKDKNREISIQALYHIYKTLHKMRTIRKWRMPECNISEQDEEISEIISQEYDIEEKDFEVWLFKNHDWYSQKDEHLSGYIPSQNINQINKTIEECDIVNIATLNLHLEMSKQNIAQRSAKPRRFINEKLPSIPTSNNLINPFLTREWIELTNTT